MNACAWRARLLEADPPELSGAADTDLGRHLATCTACSADAQRILGAYAALDALLDAHPPFDAAALVARVRGADREGMEGGPATTAGSAPGSSRPYGRGRGRRWAAAWIPLVAAAALAALLLRGPSEPELLPGAAPMVLAPPDVSAPEGVNFAVIPTADPDITVVWIFQGEG